MNEHINKEFSKIRSSFSKVKDDLMHVSSQVHETYHEMMSKHDALASEVNFLSSQLKAHIESFNKYRETISKSQIDHMKSLVKDLKSEVSEAHKLHNQLSIDITNIKKQKVEARELTGMQEKLHTTETEIFMLKERMLEKDIEMKQLKDMNKKLFEVVEDLSNVEMHLHNQSPSKQHM